MKRLFGLGLFALLLGVGVGALAGTASSASTTQAVTQVRGGHKRDGLILRYQRQQQRQQQRVATPWSRLMRVQGGIAQSKHADLYTEAIGTGIITASAGLLGKTDLPGTCFGDAVRIYDVVRGPSTRLNSFPINRLPHVQGAYRGWPSAPWS